MWRLYFQLSAEGKKRLFNEILPLLHDTKAAVLGDRDDEAWYLVYLGTKPNSQGRGYAARLLQDMMARVSSPRLTPAPISLLLSHCRGSRPADERDAAAVEQADAENRPMYLESSSQANNAYYEKFGFEVKRDIFLERGPAPVRLSVMVREPRALGCKVAHAGTNKMARKFGGVGKRG
jgi:ribosomal protein S18 acetylase RimI-like enzyme